MQHATKQTAANNAFLRRVKSAMNKAIYTQTSYQLNANGQEAANAYLRQYFKPEYQAERLAYFVDGTLARGDSSWLQK
jgi:hypothetical protein